MNDAAFEASERNLAEFINARAMTKQHLTIRATEVVTVVQVAGPPHRRMQERQGKPRMTSSRFRQVICSACGTSSRQQVLLSTNSFLGSPDLDLRPPEMERSTMSLWLQECPNCGFVSGDLAAAEQGIHEILSTEPTALLRGKMDRSLIRRCLTRSLIDEEIRKKEAAAEHALWADGQQTTPKMERRLSIDPEPPISFLPRHPICRSAPTSLRRCKRGPLIYFVEPGDGRKPPTSQTLFS